MSVRKTFQKGEIATIATLIGLGIMVLGVIVGNRIQSTDNRSSAQTNPTIPNCYNLTVKDSLTKANVSSLTVGKNYDITGYFSLVDTSHPADFNGEYFLDNIPGSGGKSIGGGKFNLGPPMSQGRSYATIWTPTSADIGNHTINCRAWNDSVAECRPKSFVTGPPQYECAGPTNQIPVTVSAPTFTCSIQSPNAPYIGGQSYQLQALPQGGIGPYTYEWTSIYSGQAKGTFDAPMSQSPKWNAPTVNGFVDVSVTIKDSIGTQCKHGLLAQTQVPAATCLTPATPSTPVILGRTSTAQGESVTIQWTPVTNETGGYYIDYSAMPSGQSPTQWTAVVSSGTTPYVFPRSDAATRKITFGTGNESKDIYFRVRGIYTCPTGNVQGANSPPAKSSPISLPQVSIPISLSILQTNATMVRFTAKEGSSSEIPCTDVNGISDVPINARTSITNIRCYGNPGKTYAITFSSYAGSWKTETTQAVTIPTSASGSIPAISFTLGTQQSSGTPITVNFHGIIDSYSTTPPLSSQGYKMNIAYIAEGTTTRLNCVTGFPITTPDVLGACTSKIAPGKYTFDFDAVDVTGQNVASYTTSTNSVIIPTTDPYTVEFSSLGLPPPPAPPASKPDLQIVNITQQTLGSTAIIAVNIKNNGTVAIPNAATLTTVPTIKYVIKDGSQIVCTVPDFPNDIRGLAAGVTNTWSAVLSNQIYPKCPSFQPVGGKVYSLSLTVDSSNTIAESNETNNESVSTYTQPGTSAPPPSNLPDLQIIDITQQTLGNTAVIAVQIKNNGTAPVPNATTLTTVPTIKYIIKDGSQVVCTVSDFPNDVRGLAAGVTNTWSAVLSNQIYPKCPSFQPVGGKVYSLSLTVDSSNTIAESNETNNESVSTYTQPATGPQPAVCADIQAPATLSVDTQYTKLVWGAVSGASRYALRIDKEPINWGSNITDCSQVSPEDTCEDSLTTTQKAYTFDPGKAYKVWVHAIRDCTGTQPAWSPKKETSFTVPGNPPPQGNTVDVPVKITFINPSNSYLYNVAAIYTDTTGHSQTINCKQGNVSGNSVTTSCVGLTRGVIYQFHANGFVTATGNPINIHKDYMIPSSGSPTQVSLEITFPANSACQANQTACGTICCASGDTCTAPDTCTPAGGPPAQTDTGYTVAVTKPDTTAGPFIVGQDMNITWRITKKTTAPADLNPPFDTLIWVTYDKTSGGTSHYVVCDNDTQTSVADCPVSGPSSEQPKTSSSGEKRWESMAHTWNITAPPSNAKPGTFRIHIKVLPPAGYQGYKRTDGSGIPFLDTDSSNTSFDITTSTNGSTGASGATGSTGSNGTTTGKADLAIDQDVWDAMEYHIQSDGTYKLSIPIKNAGTSATTNTQKFSVSVFFNPSVSAQDASTLSTELPGLKASDTFSVSKSIPPYTTSLTLYVKDQNKKYPLTATGNLICLLYDTASTLQETDETNNAGCHIFDLPPSPNQTGTGNNTNPSLKPDLIIDTLSAGKSSNGAGYDVFYTVRNIGQGITTGEFLTYVYINPEGILPGTDFSKPDHANPITASMQPVAHMRKTNQIKPGRAFERTSDPVTLIDGKNVICIWTDKENTLSETKEDNNQKCITYDTTAVAPASTGSEGTCVNYGGSCQASVDICHTNAGVAAQTLTCPAQGNTASVCCIPAVLVEERAKADFCKKKDQEGYYRNPDDGTCYKCSGRRLIMMADGSSTWGLPVDAKRCDKNDICNKAPAGVKQIGGKCYQCYGTKQGESYGYLMDQCPAEINFSQPEGVNQGFYQLMNLNNLGELSSSVFRKFFSFFTRTPGQLWEYWNIF